MYPINIGAEEPWIRKRSVLYFEKGLEAAEVLGIDKMLVTPGDGYRDKPADDTQEIYDRKSAVSVRKSKREKYLSFVGAFNR